MARDSMRSTYNNVIPGRATLHGRGSARPAARYRIAKNVGVASASRRHGRYAVSHWWSRDPPSDTKVYYHEAHTSASFLPPS